MKKPGKATVTIKGMGGYTGSRKKYYYIAPAKPTVTKASSDKAKSLTIVWKKDTLADGYHIRISADKDFTNVKKSVYIKKNTTVKRTFSALTTGKTYYVQVRAFKTVDGKKITGKYSAAKKVKIQ